MITLPLRMRYGEKPLRQAAAWLIPGAEPRVWLDEMLAWGVPLGEAVLYPIPRSARDLSPQGVLVVLPEGLVPRTTHRSQPYAALVAAGGRLASGKRRRTVVENGMVARPVAGLTKDVDAVTPRPSQTQGRATRRRVCLGSA